MSLLIRAPSNPASSGLTARIGTFALEAQTGNLWVKYGTSNTAWRAAETVVQGGVFVLNQQTTTVGNVGAAETTLHTYTLPTETLAVNGQSLDIEYVLGFTGNANNKRVRAYFGATTMYDTTAVAKNGGSAYLRVRLWRTSAIAQRMIAVFTDSTDTVRFANGTFYTTAAESLVDGTGDVIRVTGEGTADNDVVCRASSVRWVNYA